MIPSAASAVTVWMSITVLSIRGTANARDANVPAMTAKHGSRTRYVHGPDEHGEPVPCRCFECRAANAEAAKDQRRQRKKDLAAGRKVRHGLASTYSEYGCRCKRCTKANTEKGRK